MKAITDTPQPKLRGIPRRIRALRKWALGFSGYFPSQHELDPDLRKWNWKIPVDCGLVEGRYATPEIQRECAQLLIQACSLLIEAKPAWAKQYRVTCCICLPDMFTSEVCIYLDEGYYQSHVAPASSQFGHQETIMDRSLASRWRLQLPSNVDEAGILWCYNVSTEIDEHYVSEHWMYGETA